METSRGMVTGTQMMLQLPHLYLNPDLVRIREALQFMGTHVNAISPVKARASDKEIPAAV